MSKTEELLSKLNDVVKSVQPEGGATEIAAVGGLWASAEGKATIDVEATWGHSILIGSNGRATGVTPASGEIKNTKTGGKAKSAYGVIGPDQSIIFMKPSDMIAKYKGIAPGVLTGADGTKGANADKIFINGEQATLTASADHLKIQITVGGEVMGILDPADALRVAQVEVTPWLTQPATTRHLVEDASLPDETTALMADYVDTVNIIDGATGSKAAFRTAALTSLGIAVGSATLKVGEVARFTAALAGRTSLATPLAVAIHTLDTAGADAQRTADIQASLPGLWSALGGALDALLGAHASTAPPSGSTAAAHLDKPPPPSGGSAHASTAPPPGSTAAAHLDKPPPPPGGSAHAPTAPPSGSTAAAHPDVTPPPSGGSAHASTAPPSGSAAAAHLDALPPPSGGSAHATAAQPSGDAADASARAVRGTPWDHRPPRSHRN